MRLNMLYIGDLWIGSTALHRLQAIKKLNYNVKEIDSTPVLNSIQDLLFRVSCKLKLPIDWNGLNKKIIYAIDEHRFDVIWIDKGLFIRPNTLKYVKQKGIYLLNYSPDDMINKKNQSFYYLSSMSIYDVHVTTKSYNIDEYKKMGAKKVVFIDNAFDPSLHRPMQLTKKEISEFGSSVGFIGSYELDRFQSIEYLCKNGVEVKVYGKSWSDLKNKIPNLIVDSNDYFDNDYVKILNCIDINLCFLRKQNRDLQTTRTLEITACGRFMIAERTVEHLRLFDENNEVVFFEDDSELLEKVRYYLDKKDLREQIGNSARIRCIESRYDNLSRIEQVLNNINN